ncbi:MAG: hypothetical protein AABX54_00560 [Nanoarchaeota archaeon]
MTEIKRYYKEAIERLLNINKFEPKRARLYLESIAYQLAMKFPDEKEFIRVQLVRACQISSGYESPVAVLRELDVGVERYLRRNPGFDLFENITIHSPAKPRSLDDFEEELDFLLGGK